MKVCEYCGKENDDATRCFQCGSENFVTDAASEGEETAAPADLQLRDIVAKPENLFRTLVVVASGTYVLGLLVPFVEPRFLEFETVDLLNYDGYAALLTMPTGVVWLMNLVYLAASIGLYRFSASARTLFAIFTVAFGVMSLLNGVRVTSPLVCFLSVPGALADGAILLMAYATPLKEKFG